MRSPSSPLFAAFMLCAALGCTQDWDSLEPDGTAAWGGAGSGDASTGGAGGDSGSAGTGIGGAGGVAGSETGGSSGAPADCDEPNAVVWDDNGHCYFALDQEDDWFSQRDECESKGAYLATITSQGEQSFVEALENERNRWIGLSKIDADDFSWVTGETVGYLNWMPGDPNESDDACVRLRENGKWSDRPCDDDYIAICERE